MQYQVPQFIEVEDKIFGPLTFKQFAFVAGGAAACFLAYRFLPHILAFIIIIPVGLLSLALAFYKVNNRPFIEILEAAIRYMLGGKLYKWKKEPRRASSGEAVAKAAQTLAIPTLSGSRLKELTWSLDVNETIYSKKGGLATRSETQKVNKPSDELQSFKGLPSDINSL